MDYYEACHRAAVREDNWYGRAMTGGRYAEQSAGNRGSQMMDSPRPQQLNEPSKKTIIVTTGALLWIIVSLTGEMLLTSFRQAK
jgi:hypothetical protein